MNSLVQRFSNTGPVAQIEKARRAAAEDGEDFGDAAWGSEAGFGSVAKGVPTFTVPAIPDVSRLLTKEVYFELVLTVDR